MKITTYTIQSIDPLIITDSNNGKHQGEFIYPLLDYLFLNHQDDIKAAWNLDEFVAVICRHLSKDDLAQLIDKGKITHVGPMDYKLFYIPSKLFSIEKRNVEVKFYGLDQYFKTPINSIEDGAHQLLEALGIMNLHPTKLTSPIAIYEECIMPHMSFHPADELVLQIPKPALRYIWHCVNEGWVEAYKLGFFQQTYYYDMDHAYPMASMGLVNTKGGHWYQSDVYQPDAIYGYCRGRVNIKPNASIHPIIYKDPDGVISRPIGSWYTYLPKCKIDFINYWQIGAFEIENGWWMEHEAPSYPLKQPMRKIIGWKLHSNPIVSLMGKSISVGHWGKWAEQYRVGFGPYFNPVWFVEVPHRVDCKLGSFIYHHKLMDSVIHVKIDGILCDKEIDIIKSTLTHQKANHHNELQNNYVQT